MMKIWGCVVIKVYGAAPNSILYWVSHKLERGVNMTWREGSIQAGFSIVGLHKIHHDDMPQVLTEKLAQELRECAHNMHKDRF